MLLLWETRVVSALQGANYALSRSGVEFLLLSLDLPMVLVRYKIVINMAGQDPGNVGGGWGLSEQSRTKLLSWMAYIVDDASIENKYPVKESEGGVPEQRYTCHTWHEAERDPR